MTAYEAATAAAMSALVLSSFALHLALRTGSNGWLAAHHLMIVAAWIGLGVSWGVS